MPGSIHARTAPFPICQHLSGWLGGIGFHVGGSVLSFDKFKFSSILALNLTSQLKPSLNTPLNCDVLQPPYRHHGDDDASLSPFHVTPATRTVAEIYPLVPVPLTSGGGHAWGSFLSDTGLNIVCLW